MKMALVIAAATIAAAVSVGAIHVDEKPKIPELLTAGRRRVLTGRDLVIASVRVPEHVAIRSVRLEMWELREVSITDQDILPVDERNAMPEERDPARSLMMSDFTRWEPNGHAPINASERPVVHGTNQSVYDFQYMGPFPPGKYRLIAKAILNTLVTLVSKPFDFQIA